MGRAARSSSCFPPPPPPDDYVYGVVASDWNGDGKPDLAIESVQLPVYPIMPHRAHATVLLGNGDGSFKPQPSFSVGLGVERMEAADVNGDGKPDLVAVESAPVDVEVFLGVGDGSFGGPFTSPGGPGVLVGPPGIGLSDFDGDGRLDLVLNGALGMAALGTVGVRVGDNNGNFEPPSLTLGMGVWDGGAQYVRAADLDQDGRPDLVIVAGALHNIGCLSGACAYVFMNTSK